MSGLNSEFSPSWYVIHTHPKQESRAESNLLAWRVETFVPRYKARRRNQFTSEPSYTIRPLFPGYIFARLEALDMFHKIRYTRGVRGIVSAGDEPVPLDDSIIAMIMSRGGSDGLVKFEDEIKTGDEVVVNGSAFSGFVGVFDRRMKDSERVIVLLKTAYQFRVVLPEKHVTKSAAARPAAQAHHPGAR
ncbi:MAG TPA: transcription termination/antitermination NusG family protein [Pyrinomonadaceae bacterium]|jgi:transcriptional antiterminator RfaH